MGTPESTQGTDEVVTISPRGDVVLVVGPGALRLRVHSLLLGSASKVFGAMLGPNWSKGQVLSEASPQEVILGEDDAEAMRTICYVIHHRNDDVPQDLSPDQLLNVAIAIDKYDLVVAFRYAAPQWLKPLDSHSFLETGYLMASAYLVCSMERFEEFTLKLVLAFSSSYLELLEDERVRQAVPFRAICT